MSSRESKRILQSKSELFMFLWFFDFQCLKIMNQEQVYKAFNTNGHKLIKQIVQRMDPIQRSIC